MRWYYGKRFLVYEVVRVTPQTLTVHHIKSVETYTKWNATQRDVATRIERDTELAGVFSYEGEAKRASHEHSISWRPTSKKSVPDTDRLYIRKSDADARREYNNIKKTKKTVHTFDSIELVDGTMILHDVGTGKLVVA
jgi:hypothetical protein